MPQESNNSSSLASKLASSVSFHVGTPDTLSAMTALPALQPFAPEAVSFLHEVSKKLMRQNGGYSDVITFAFWCRKAALEQYRSQYADLNQRLGRGIAFHIAPSNVPVNFAFSLCAGLLAGNANIVRVPSKPFPQVSLIVRAINETLSEHEDLRAIQQRLCLVSYPSASKEATDMFSQLCDIRVIWGGDATIAAIRQSPLRPRAAEITFADRFSLALISAHAILRADNLQKIAQAFYNDTYFSDQNACTAPRMVLWLNDCETPQDVFSAQKRFWSAVHAIVTEKYTLAPVQAVGKLSAFCRLAIGRDVVLLSDRNDGYITRIGLKSLDSDIMNYKYHSGFFFEHVISNLSDMLPICTERCQTLSYFGLDAHDLLAFIHANAPRGVDRIVPMGSTMDFSLLWDGVDLIERMSRKVACSQKHSKLLSVQLT